MNRMISRDLKTCPHPPRSRILGMRCTGRKCRKFYTLVSGRAVPKFCTNEDCVHALKPGYRYR